MSEPTYRILRSNDPGELAALVEASIAEGFAPVGGVARSGNLFFQAVVRTDPAPGRGDPSRKLKC